MFYKLNVFLHSLVMYRTLKIYQRVNIQKYLKYVCFHSHALSVLLCPLYIGYAARLLSSHHLVPSLIPSPHFCQNGSNRSNPDPLNSTSILNYSSCSKSGEMEDHLFLLELEESGSRLDRFWWWMKLYLTNRN